jgi:hypothetical protein
MIGERDAIHVERLALEPVRAGIDVHKRRHRSSFVCLSLHADARIVLQRQQMINDIETLGALRPVHGRDVHHHREAEIRAQRLDHAHDLRQINFDRQFAIGDVRAFHRAGQRSRDLSTEFAKVCHPRLSDLSCRCGGFSAATA